jgi:hypothetical protein
MKEGRKFVPAVATNIQESQGTCNHARRGDGFLRIAAAKLGAALAFEETRGEL